MSKFLDLVKENTPGEEQESLADKFHRFADKVSAFEGGRGDVDILLVDLNDLNEELTTLGGIPEDQELRVDDAKVAQAGKLLKAAEQITGVRDPRRRLTGIGNPIKNVEKSVGDLYNKVATKVKEFAREF